VAVIALVSIANAVAAADGSGAPISPDAPTGRDWLARELAKPEYVQAKPTWFDLLAKAFADWLNSLNFAGANGPSGFGIGLIVVVVIVAIVIAFLIFGVPRLNRRSADTGALFGTDDERTSAQMRDSALSAALRGDFSFAIAELFRSIARGLGERTIVTTSPGTTAREFARTAATAFPELAAQFSAAATSFDDVRYLGLAGSREQYEQLVELEQAVRRSRAEFATAAP